MSSQLEDAFNEAVELRVAELREADRAVILEWAKFTRDESAGYWGRREEDVYQRLLAAADREAPDGETPAASPDERLREALTAAHDALRAYAISAPCPGIEVDWAEGEVSGCRDDPAPRDCPTCAAVAAALAGVSAEAAPDDGGRS